MKFQMCRWSIYLYGVGVNICDCWTGLLKLALFRANKVVFHTNQALLHRSRGVFRTNRSVFGRNEYEFRGNIKIRVP